MSHEHAPPAGTEPFPVAIVHWAFAPVVGGVETHLAEYAQALMRRGHSVVVISGTENPRDVHTLQNSPGPAMVEHLYHPALDLERFPTSATRRELDAYADEFAEWLHKELAKRDVRLIHGHNLHYFTPIPAIALNRITAELRLALHHTYHSIWLDSLDIARHCRDWPGKYVWSSYVQSFCRDHLDVATELTRPGIDIQRFRLWHPPRRDAGRYVMLHPARLVTEKGPDISIKVLSALRDAGIPASLVLTQTSNIVDWKKEKPKCREMVDSLIDELGVGGAVEFRDVPYSKMPELYRDCDVVVYPSRYPEPLGLVPLEAAAASRPVVVTGVGGLPETIVDGMTGYVIPIRGATDSLIEDDLIASYVDRLGFLYAHSAEAYSMAREARRHVTRWFDLDAYVDGMIARYRLTMDETG